MRSCDGNKVFITIMASYINHAAAGTTFQSMEDAGQYILDVYCHNFPHTESSFILPPIFPTTFPECRDSSTKEIVKRQLPPLTRKEENKFRGIQVRQVGDVRENIVFSSLKKLIVTKETNPMLVLNSYRYNYYVCEALTQQYRHISNEMETFKKSFHVNYKNIHGEHDIVILIKRVGLVFVEIKTSSTPVNVVKAEQQLARIQQFMSILISCVAPSTCSTSVNLGLPVVKIIMVPYDTQTSIGLQAKGGCLHFYKDSIDNLVKSWEDVVNVLQQQTKNYKLTEDEFDKLSYLVTAIWGMEATKGGVDYNIEKGSLASQLKIVDDMVEHAHLTSDAKVVKTKKRMIEPVTNVFCAEQNSVFRQGAHINLVYLTMQQKYMFENVRQCIIRGHAGTGKTILMLFKIIELVSKQSPYKILLVAPHPHQIRCKNILERNNVTVLESETIPSTLPTADVLLIKMSDFSCTCQPDISDYHVFVDDVHAFDAAGRSTADFMDLTYVLKSRCQQTDFETKLYTWFALDAMQEHIYDVDHKQSPFNLLYTHGKELIRGIPTYNLTKVLRNSLEITHTIMKIRLDAIKEKQIPSHMVTSHEEGHNIHGAHVEIHILTNCGDRDEVISLFLAEISLKEIGLLVANNITTNQRLQPKDIAIIYDNPDYSDVITDIKNMLSTKFDIKYGTVEGQLNRNTDMVVDSIHEINSAEWPCVIYITTGFSPSKSFAYRAATRARSKLIIVDADRYGDSTFRGGNFTRICNVVYYKEEDNNFNKIDTYEKCVIASSGSIF